MNILFEWSFWLVVIIAYPLLQVFSDSLKLTAFGALSFLGVFLLGGVEVVALASGVVFSAWLAALAIIQDDRKISVFFIICLIVFSLSIYKLLQANSAFLFVFSSDGSFGHSLFSSLAFLGFSYAALRFVDFVLAVKSGARVVNFLALFGYLFPIHMLLAGPISLYKNYLSSETQRPITQYADFVSVINYLVTGLLYKVVIAESIRIVGWGVHAPMYSDSLLDTSLIFVYLFFDFAGYSMVAVAIGKLLGISTPQNFNKPFVAVNITDFWTRWHMSLSQFVRQNVYYPVQVSMVRRYGIQQAKSIAFFSSAISFSVVGLWHQFTFSFLLWGLLLGVIMGAEKVIRDKVVKIPSLNSPFMQRFKLVVGPIYVFVVISCSLHLIINDMF